MESQNAIEVSEDGYEPVIYFPRADIAMAFLDPSETRTHCPHKGDASYFSIETKNGPIPDAAWSYETPNPDVIDLKDHVAFYLGEKIAIEHV